MARPVPPALYTTEAEKTKDNELRHKTFTTWLPKVGHAATASPRHRKLRTPDFGQSVLIAFTKLMFS